MNAPHDSSEDQRCLLTEHLLKAVANGISGRDGEDVIDTSPSRAIFAGVLQTVRRQQSNSAVAVGTTDATPPADTSLGLDFRVVGPTTPSTVRLTITPKFSVYYPVFPTYEQALVSNRSMLDLPKED